MTNDELIGALESAEEALVEAISQLDEMCGELHGENYNDPELNRALGEIRAALRKARGEV
jgi:hypothetical protein